MYFSLFIVFHYNFRKTSEVRSQKSECCLFLNISVQDTLQVWQEKKCGAVQYFYNILPKRIGIIRKSIYLCSIEMRNM